MKNALVSKCFSGFPCRYHGRPVFSPAKMARLSKMYNLILVCPEELGGLPTPRPAAPLKNKNGNKIFDTSGQDVSAAFLRGALAVVKISRDYSCSVAFLCKNSPSCDKTGFTGEALIESGVRVRNL